jgi:hypothetical protein
MKGSKSYPELVTECIGECNIRGSKICKEECIGKNKRVRKEKK